MRITTITYAFTKNLGNYQSQRLEATAEVEPNSRGSATERELQIWVLEPREHQKTQNEPIF